MKNLIKQLEAIGSTQSIQQNQDCAELLNDKQKEILKLMSQELACSHFPGDDDDD